VDRRVPQTGRDATSVPSRRSGRTSRSRDLSRQSDRIRLDRGIEHLDRVRIVLVREHGAFRLQDIGDNPLQRDGARFGDLRRRQPRPDQFVSFVQGRSRPRAAVENSSAPVTDRALIMSSESTSAKPIDRATS
jgi:hypothetical protein